MESTGKTVGEVNHIFSTLARIARAGLFAAALAKTRSGRLLSALMLFTITILCPLNAHEKRKEDYGFGLSVEIPAPESEVLQAVSEVVEDGIIQGSKEYNKDQYIERAGAAASSDLFPKENLVGTVFYKVRKDVIAPANFKDTQDSGSLAVRYVVRGEEQAKTILRIDAVYLDNFRHAIHPSNGMVESGEYKAIQDQIDSIELKKKQTTEAENSHQEQLAQQALARPPDHEDEASRLVAAQSSAQTLEEHVADLRRQVERLVKAPGAQLKTAPFHSASAVKTLAGGTEVVILIVTPYWYGVETEDGQHGWLNRGQLEPLP